MGFDVGRSHVADRQRSRPQLQPRQQQDRQGRDQQGDDPDFAPGDLHPTRLRDGRPAQASSTTVAHHAAGRARPLRSRSIGRRSPSMALATTLSPWLIGLIGADDLLDQFVADDIALGEVHEANALNAPEDVLHFD